MTGSSYAQAFAPSKGAPLDLHDPTNPGAGQSSPTRTSTNIMNVLSDKDYMAYVMEKYV